jgi:hypothetical protein
MCIHLLALQHQQGSNTWQLQLLREPKKQLHFMAYQLPLLQFQEIGGTIFKLTTLKQCTICRGYSRGTNSSDAFKSKRHNEEVPVFAWNNQADQTYAQTFSLRYFATSASTAASTGARYLVWMKYMLKRPSEPVF